MENQIIFTVKASGTLEAIEAVEAIQSLYPNAKISVEVVVG